MTAHKHVAGPTMSIEVSLNCRQCLSTAINTFQHRIDALMPPFPTEKEIEDEKLNHVPLTYEQQKQRWLDANPPRKGK